MEINLNNNGFGNIGLGRDAFNATGVDAGRETTGSSQTSRNTSLHISASPSSVQSTGPASAEPVMDIPDSALSRDDELGNLMNAAFNFPAPPMPNFAT